MLDLTSEKGRFVSAALGLAAERPWGQVTLADIAARAGSTLVALKAHFTSKGAILAELSRLVDEEMLRRAPRRGEGQAARDALFEVIMSRFDILEPYKGALKSIAAAGLPEPLQIGQIYDSQRWTLEAAGISAGGVGGGVRTAGLATIYAAVFRTWLEDSDPGLARTMAALDRRLRRGQRALERIDDVRTGLGRVGAAICDAVRGAARRGDGRPAAGEPARPPAQPSP